MPAIARVQHDRAQLSHRVASLVGALAAVALPISALILALAEPVVVGVYGARWSGATGRARSAGRFRRDQGPQRPLRQRARRSWSTQGPVRSPGALAQRSASRAPDRSACARHPRRRAGACRGSGRSRAADVPRPADTLDGRAAAPAGRRRPLPAAASAVSASSPASSPIASTRRWGTLALGGAAGVVTFLVVALPWCRTRF